jgi:peptide-methionine (S)-S-oxide reductase
VTLHTLFLIAVVLALAAILWRKRTMASTLKAPLPAPVHDIFAPEAGWEAGQHETAVFAGGCFWGVQSVFQRVKGVIATTVGYSGGAAETANYRAVCGEDTGHAEAIKIVYDPALVSYGTLLRQSIRRWWR